MIQKTLNAPIVRTMGCWNCAHWSQSAGRAFWAVSSQRDLKHAVELALASPEGEQAQHVVNIRRMVAKTDEGVAQGHLGKCAKQDAPREMPVGDLVSHAYLCELWTGSQGASLAREGAKLDKLPEELMADVLADAERGG